MQNCIPSLLEGIRRGKEERAGRARGRKRMRWPRLLDTRHLLPSTPNPPIRMEAARRRHPAAAARAGGGPQEPPTRWRNTIHADVDL
jgi:hypothetical protein